MKMCPVLHRNLNGNIKASNNAMHWLAIIVWKPTDVDVQPTVIGPVMDYRGIVKALPWLGRLRAIVLFVQFCF